MKVLAAPQFLRYSSTVRFDTFILHVSPAPASISVPPVPAPLCRMGISGVDLFLYCETDIDIIIDQASHPLAPG